VNVTKALKMTHSQANKYILNTSFLVQHVRNHITTMFTSTMLFKEKPISW